MDHLLFQFDFWLAALGLVILFRQLRVVLGGEQGRKQDLSKKLYKANLDFHISVLIPYLDSNKLDKLLALLQAIQSQEYPTTKVAIHLVATHRTATDMDFQTLYPNLKVWTYPIRKAHPGEAISWLIERCLARGGTGLFVFLKPDDIVKPDFFQNIAARSLEKPVLQGYVAMKQWPDTLLGKVVALSNRLTNRVWNAGRYHLGLSARLMDSGWVVQREILEMVPYRRGRDIENLEYTIRLNLENFKVAWAPQVVVYSSEPDDFIQHVRNRFQMAFLYASPLLTRAFVKLDFGALEQLLSIIKPPHFMLGLLMGVMALRASLGFQPSLGGAVTWSTLAIGTFILQVLSLLVARSRGADALTFFFMTPVAYLLGVFSIPAAILKNAVLMWTEAKYSQEERQNSQQLARTRFNETLEFELPYQDHPEVRDLQPQQAYTSSPQKHALEKRLQNHQLEQIPLDSPDVEPAFEAPKPREQRRRESAKVPAYPIEQVKVVPLSNGQKQVDCQLTTVTNLLANGDETFHMTLQYKTVAFSTSSYKILDQAFYELLSKLKSKGFTLLTCGSCGNYYNPAVDVSKSLKTTGVCLFGKMGKEINISTDAVTVLSQACPYHCALEERETIVRQWRNSVSMVNRP
jgi:hypothetical protein